VRAPAVDPERELEELRRYLGERFDERLLRGHAQAVEEELRAVGGDEARLYRTSEAYLYDLTVFAMSRTKEPYLRVLARLRPPPARILDYGCGIGSDGLALLEAGYEVAFADFDNPSTRYLRWRLRERGHDAQVYDLDASPPPAGFDAAICFDVIEHVEDPFGLLGELERRAAVVVVNVLEPAPFDPSLHYELPVRALVAHAAARGLLHHGVYHDRSHLVAYRPGRGRSLRGLRARTRVAVRQRARRPSA
jgi:SAM-dependent methyltransferase